MSNFTDSIGTWELDEANSRFVRKDEEGNVNGEATFDYVRATLDAPAWFHENLPAVSE
jgi:hypothetical protein